MELNKISVVLLPLIAGICAAGITLKSVEPIETLQINEAAINVILSCYKNKGNAVAVVGDVSNVLIKALAYQRIPIAAINDLNIAETQEFILEEFELPYKLKVFVIAITPHTDFRQLAIQMYVFNGWNIMASFLLLYQSPRGCKDANNVLIEAWIYSLINAKLICFDRQLGIRIFGYNPYGYEAPKPWRLWGTLLPTVDGVRWDFMTFERSYLNGNGICKNLDFEKMKNLNGYPVEIMFPSYSYRKNWVYDGWFNINQKKGTRANDNQKSERAIKNPKSRMMSGNYGLSLTDLMKTVIRAMNGTAFRRRINCRDDDPCTDDIRDLMHGSAPLVSALVMPASRTFDTFEIVVLTHNRGYMSQLQKIFSVVDVYSNIAVGSALAGILIFFKFFAHQATTSAILNIVRIMCNTGFTNVPEDTPRRVFLTGVLLFAVVMQGIYQGNLAALLTNEVPLPNIDTRQNLIDSDHEIYVAYGDQRFFTEPELRNRLIVQVGKYDCIEHVVHNLSTACVSDSHVAMDSPDNIHVSEPFLSTLGVLWYRPNWPSAERLNTILGKLIEADLIMSFDYRIGHQTLSDFLLIQKQRYSAEFRDLTFSNLGFAFVILGIGSTCAFITFVFEIVVHRISLRNRVKRVVVLPFSPTMERVLPADEDVAKSMS